MNAFNPLIFAASFPDFAIDTNGEVTIQLGATDSAQFTLCFVSDSDITVVAKIALTPKESAYYFQPVHSNNPEDEVEVGYWGCEVKDCVCAYVLETKGVTVSHNQPFILTSEQKTQLNAELDSIALREFEKEINSFEPDYEECF